MNISTEHISKCNQSVPLADASGRIVDMMNENVVYHNIKTLNLFCFWRSNTFVGYFVHFNNIRYS